MTESFQHLSKKNNYFISESNNFYTNHFILARHQERMDYPDQSNYSKQTWEQIRNKWFQSERFFLNQQDTPLTDRGLEFAQKKAKIFYNYIKKNNIPCPILLYSSPFQRCIQTTGEIQKFLQKKLNKKIQIQIEYGLAEPVILPNKVEWDTKKKEFVWTANKNIIHESQQNGKINKEYKTLDSHQTLEKIIERFPQYKFQTNYKPIVEFKEFYVENLLDYAQRIQYTLETIQKKNKNTLHICIGHGHLLRFGTEYFTKIPLEDKLSKELITTKGYGCFAIFENKKDNYELKILCKGNTSYEKILDKYNVEKNKLNIKQEKQKSILKKAGFFEKDKDFKKNKKVQFKNIHLKKEKKNNKIKTNKENIIKNYKKQNEKQNEKQKFKKMNKIFLKNQKINLKKELSFEIKPNLSPHSFFLKNKKEEKQKNYSNQDKNMNYSKENFKTKEIHIFKKEENKIIQSKNPFSK